MDPFNPFPGWTSKVILKLKLNPLRLEEVVQEDRVENRQELGIVWHAFDEPNTATVGMRAEKTDGVYTSCRIGGRPRPRHGNSHGQHTTAFCVSREAVAASVVGRTEEEAREDIAFLFKTLLGFPAMSDPHAPPSEQLVARIKALADPASEASTALSVDELGVLYLEIRDSLPGASLNTGLDSTVSGSGHSNVTGKGEGTRLRSLRSAENDAMAGKELGSKRLKSVTDNMLKLYDVTSEDQMPALPDEMRAAQRATFLMTMAQAFPVLMARKDIRDAMIKQLDECMTKEQVKDLVGKLEAITDRLADRNSLGERPQTTAFAATIKNGRFVFDARPKSVKDGGMGDHTTALTLMANAATRLIMPNGLTTTNKELIQQLTLVCGFFDPEDYLPILEAKVSEEDAVLIAPYQQRLVEMARHWQAAADLIQTLKRADPNAPAGADILAEAAEAYMTLVDDRPTAVCFKGVASGGKEPHANKALKKWEADLGDATEEVIFGKMKDLFDARAVYAGAEIFQPPKFVDLSPYLTRAVEEFLFFFGNAYPNLYQKAVLSQTFDVRAALYEYVDTIGPLPKSDDIDEEDGYLEDDDESIYSDDED